MQIEFKQKAIRSYVIRGGRITEGQKKAFDRWWPDLGLSLHDGQIEFERTFQNRQPVVFEIGFGMGDSLFDMAQANPDQNFIGVEVHPPGVGRLMNNVGKAGLRNLKVYMADAIDVLKECIPENSLERVQLFFPDPWHKKKHNKRRIVQEEFVHLVRSRLRPGGVFHAATDWEAYADHMMEVLTRADGMQNCVAEYQYAPAPDYRPHTKFEKRGEKLGHGVWDILFFLNVDKNY